MFEFACHCGAVRISVARLPDFINACNCSLCRKSGVQWGYFDNPDVTVAGTTASYRRRDKPEPAVALHFCPTCGASTHFVLLPAVAARLGSTMMGVNMVLADESVLAGIELRFPDGQAWSGEGPFGDVRPPVIIGAMR